MQRRYPTLDLLRLVAITMTMLAHARGIVQHVIFLRPVQHGMWLGVDLFMLISGWLLGGQLLRDAQRGALEPLRFYVKRWLRTLPPYYAMLVLLYFAGSPVVGGTDGTEYVLDPARTNHWDPGLPWQVVVTHLTFLQRYIPPNLYGVSWSLCVEEHFYLVLPVIVYALMRWPRFGVVLGIVFGMEAISIVCRVFAYVPYAWTPQATHMRCDGLFLGLLFAWINIHRPAYWKALGRVAEGLAVVGVIGTLLVMASVVDVPTRWTYIGVPTAATWTLALVFLACVHDDSRLSRFSFPGLQYLGELTYSIYLVHNVLPRAWLGEHSGQAGARGVVVRLVLVASCSILLHHLVERPALQLRERVLKRWRPRAVEEPPKVTPVEGAA